MTEPFTGIITAEYKSRQNMHLIFENTENKEHTIKIGFTHTTPVLFEIGTIYNMSVHQDVIMKIEKA